jgi:alpha-L-fucosidase
MKYVILTSKHHEGFALWDTQGTDYNIVRRTPYGKSVIEPLAEAVRRHGLHFGVYYSIMDWHHPSQYVDAPGKHQDAGHRLTVMREGHKREYVDYMKAQLRELIANYDPAVLWFDGEWV